MRKIPDWLYEPLPYAYAIMGIVATVSLEVLIGKISGLLLISAGIVIWHLRFSYRRRRRRPVARDLSWGHNQRINPPKNLDSVQLPKPPAAEPPKDPDGLL